ncbi:uncharacterized protein LOC133499286 isoform X3 [Syngnathoides biaculeatus]|uniref:uncharacterized protein LOC133499286 isoform X3 n=1 Tax=Syngnathoides biaculeatus TaxID=300417 RepID=UPI002ADE780F|nr:uncharacterized protein LOC133499286 isoform X3 [Syngnathoides biaculeatus]
MASQKQQLCGTREESERQSQQQDVIHDVWQLTGGSPTLEHTQPPYIKNEEEHADFNEFPLTVIVVKIEEDEDGATESAQLHHHIPSGGHCEGAPAENLLPPMSDSDNTEDRNDAEREADDKYLKKETTLNNKKRSHTRKEDNAVHTDFSVSNTDAKGQPRDATDAVADLMPPSKREKAEVTEVFFFFLSAYKKQKGRSNSCTRAPSKKTNC